MTIRINVFFFHYSPDENLKDKQQRICQALIGIVLSVHELVQTAFSSGACADAVTKVFVIIVLGGV